MPSSELRCIVPTDDQLGETPLWCERTQSLLWLDIERAKLQRFHPESGRHDVFAFDDLHLGSLALTQQTGVVLLAFDRALWRFDLSTGRRSLLCRVEPDIVDSQPLDNRLNDGRCDRHGRFWVGSMDNALHRPHGALYRIDADGTVVRQFGDVIVSNTITFSPSGASMTFSDTRRHTTWVFDVDDAGTLSNRRVLADYTATRDRPDGACVDAEGFIWTAFFGGHRIERLSPDGRTDRTIEMPVANPTCVCLGGPDLKTLYITTASKFLDRRQRREQPLAGAVFAIDVHVPGLPECRFGE